MTFRGGLKLAGILAKDYSFTSLDQSLDHGAFTTPDYTFRIDQDIPVGTDLLMVRVTKPYEQFDPTGNFGPYSNWRVHLQDWTDLNGDGSFWDDVNGNGKVDLDGEMQTGEHNRFTYGYNYGPTQQARIANPLERMSDGILLTFRHRVRTPLVPTTDLTVEASYWRWSLFDFMGVDKKQLVIPPGEDHHLPSSYCRVGTGTAGHVPGRHPGGLRREPGGVARDGCRGC